MSALPLPAVERAAADPVALLGRHFAQQLVALPSGAQAAVRTLGTGVPIMLLHGIGSGSASWLPCALALEPHARVIAWDAPGYGDSTPLPQSSPLASDYAQRLGELLTAMHIERCVLVGHSLGALMAAAFAHGAGHGRVSRLVLLSPARGYGAPGREAERVAARTRRLDALRTLGIEGIAARSPERMLTAHADDAARNWVRWNTARLHPAGYTQAVQMLCADDITRCAPLAVPAEVHCGDGDTVTPPAACRGVAEAFGAPFTLIANAGHACAIEQPEAVAALIVSAVNTARGAGAALP
jgi:pimeloyl-ACP methyl ester carboxylesterase